MRQTIIGVFHCGLDEIQLVLRAGCGGEFYFVPEDGHIPRIKVGADVDHWREVVSSLLHEVFEMQMTRSHCRLEPAPDYGRDHSSYLFLMTHPMFSDVAARAAGFLVDALPALASAWKRWKKPSRRKLSRKRKPKSK